MWAGGCWYVVAIGDFQPGEAALGGRLLAVVDQQLGHRHVAAAEDCPIRSPNSDGLQRAASVVLTSRLAAVRSLSPVRRHGSPARAGTTG